MSSGVVVLIAPSELLSALTPVARDGGDVLAFADTETLLALEAITHRRPDVIALERMFAATSRGAALINRIKADPALARCEIRIVAHADARAASASEATEPAPAAAAESPVPEAPLDQRGTRRAPRARMRPGVEISIDGNAARLVDLSIVGAQVIASAILRPKQRVRVVIPGAPRPLRLSAGVAWAFFEMPKGRSSPHYRAGIDFVEGDQAALQRFIDAHKQ